MPVFALIDPKARSIDLEDFPSYDLALDKVGLKAGSVDFGTVAQWKDGRNLSIIVYEWSLMDSDPEAYFACNGRLYNGPAVMYMSDAEGETIDFSPALAEHFKADCSHFLWLSSVEAAEKAIMENKVIRPQTAINGVPTWQWNKPKESV